MIMIETAAILDPRLQELLRKAAAWRMIGLLFERPRQGWREEVQRLSGEVSDPEISVAADAARGEATEGLYLAVLGPGGVASPREVAYRGMGDPGQILSDIMAFYEAFAFRPEAEEPPDHVSVEAGFMGYLCLKQAYARVRGREDEAETAAQAAARFCEEHLSGLAWPLGDRLDNTGVRYLALAGRALAERAGPRPVPKSVGETPLPSCESDCPLDCSQP
jgi:hypothetical protein